MPDDDIIRLKREYARRSRESVKDYSLSDPANLFLYEQRHKSIVSLLASGVQVRPADLKILEVGCGSGAEIEELIRLGGKSENISGIDLLLDRLVLAYTKLPRSLFSCVDAQNLPFINDDFDLILQFTAFSSILDGHIKQNMAKEMVRVLKPGGSILWYDFWLNPLNKQTRGVRLKEIRQLFPGCTYQVRKITLAPPIARILVPISVKIATLLEQMKLLNSHYLVLITPPKVIK